MQFDHRPVVHIGHSKTGTTWFQKSFYPSVTSHRFIDSGIVREALLAPNGLAFEADRARELILAAADGVPPLLCDERLSGSNLAGGLHGMVAPEVARRLKAVFPDARIVIGIRAQPEMLAAAYSQYVKDGGTHGTRRFLFPDSYFFAASEYRTQAPRFDLAHFEYQRLIRVYLDLFGKENVHVLLFEQFRAGPLDCARSLAHIGAAPPSAPCRNIDCLRVRVVLVEVALDDPQIARVRLEEQVGDRAHPGDQA